MPGNVQRVPITLEDPRFPAGAVGNAEREDRAGFEDAMEFSEESTRIVDMFKHHPSDGSIEELIAVVPIDQLAMYHVQSEDLACISGWLLTVLDTVQLQAVLLLGMEIRPGRTANFEEPLTWDL